MGAVALPIGVVLIAISEIFHPAREDPMDFPAVFREYAHSTVWTTVHLGEYFGFLLLLGGLVALYYSVSARPGAGAGLAPFGLAAAVVTAASFTVLQAVDGITLNAWCELCGHHPNRSAKASRGRPSCSLSQMQKLCKATLAASRARKPSSSWGRSRHRPKVLKSLS
jgi:hypothetical protein